MITYWIINSNITLCVKLKTTYEDFKNKYKLNIEKINSLIKNGYFNDGDFKITINNKYKKYLEYLKKDLVNMIDKLQ